MVLAGLVQGSCVKIHNNCCVQGCHIDHHNHHPMTAHTALETQILVYYMEFNELKYYNKSKERSLRHHSDFQQTLERFDHLIFKTMFETQTQNLSSNVYSTVM